MPQFPGYPVDRPPSVVPASNFGQIANPVPRTNPTPLTDFALFSRMGATLKSNTDTDSWSKRTIELPIQCNCAKFYVFLNPNTPDLASYSAPLFCMFSTVSLDSYSDTELGLMMQGTLVSGTTYPAVCVKPFEGEFATPNPAAYQRDSKIVSVSFRYSGLPLTSLYLAISKRPGAISSSSRNPTIMFSGACWYDRLNPPIDFD